MNRYRFLLYFFLLFIVISFALRAILLIYSFDNIDINILSILKIFTIGIFYDTVAFFYYIIPFVLYLFLIPDKIFNSKLHRIISFGIFFIITYSLIFDGVSEWFFWDEFGKRFNFIAVDYLVYTHEVIKNIQESYPLFFILISIFIVTLSIFYFFIIKINLFNKTFNGKSTYKERLRVTLVLMIIPFLSFYFLDKQSLSKLVSINRYNQELSKNGFYSLFSAFRNNQLDYYEFYLTQDNEKVLKRYRKLTSSKNTKFVSKNLNNPLKKVKNNGKEKMYNVMLVMIESMSASYMGIYGDKRNLTPNLDNLAKKSLFFNNLFATGTRTVRGMEAVTVSIPPTAGRSIVKRPDNHNMFNIGWIFRKKGYDNKFIYAGYSYFDNMKEYFSNNGFKVIDRFSFDKNEIHFSNVWGVCDEDLFDKSLKEADISYEKNKPFFSFIMTTSNHRPYTYPDGKIDIPSHTGRKGGVKYTDYAISNFLKKASKKSWFNNTLFIFIADHNGGSAGKTDLPLHRYKIPLIIYAPKIIKPKVITKLSSQIDLAPTLFSLMNWQYFSKFYGQNILSKDFKPRALIGNYQKLGLYQNNKLIILSPNKRVKEFKIEELNLKNSGRASQIS